MTPLRAPGTRPEPAVSVAREKLQRPAPTLTAFPLEEPPEIYSLLNINFVLPYGLRHPVRPVASWSKFVFPMSIAPSSTTFSYTTADFVGMKARGGQAVVVKIPLISILS